MGTNSSTTDKATGKAAATGSTIRPGLRVGEQVVAVQLGVWGPQEVAVRAYSGGGRGGAPYVAVSVGTCLTKRLRPGRDQQVTSWPGRPPSA